MNHNWSSEILFERSSLDRIPSNAGVYQILQDIDYPRYNAPTRVLKIGMSHDNLRKEIDNHFQRHAAANRLKRIRQQNSIILTVQFLETESSEAPAMELQLLRNFEIFHWELPLLNSTRGFARGMDANL